MACAKISALISCEYLLAHLHRLSNKNWQWSKNKGSHPLNTKILKERSSEMEGGIKVVSIEMSLLTINATVL